MEAQSLSTCNQCGKKFQRKAHLLRHQQQHSGDRPYTCKFCSKTFKRSDVLRDHFSRCDRRGTSAIPSSLERGRKRHACDECSRLKVKCDNNVPCRKCKEFGRTCVKKRSNGQLEVTSSAESTRHLNTFNYAGTSSPEHSNASPSVSTPCPDTPSDRNSIGFLLNCPGDKDFLREFPKSSTLSPKTSVGEPPNPLSMGPAGEPLIGELSGTSTGTYGSSGHPNQEDSLDLLLSNLEFETFERQHHDWQVPSEDEAIPWSRTGPLFLDRGVLEHRAFDIREKLKYTAATQNRPLAPSKELLDAVNMITADSIAAYVKLYFRHWHKHAPLIHKATFNPCTAALPLVLAVLGLGGMYSKDASDVFRLTLLLDTIEAYVYSCPGLNDEYDAPDRVYVKQGSDAPPNWQQHQLEDLQGAYLIIVLQYWAGNYIARTRVRQQRFSRIIAIFHHLDLQTVQHAPDFLVKDEESFRNWIRTESSIRTAGLATMLDNAFGIFNNVAPRIQWAEIDLCFPSDDYCFNFASYQEMAAQSAHPVRKMKVKEAFQTLLSTPEQENEELEALSTGNLTPLDMQMLIHFLYSHIWASLFNSPIFQLSSTSSLITTTIKHYKNAMANWKTVWDQIRAESDQDEWNRLGFQRTADTYFDVVSAVVEAYEKTGGRCPPFPSDCEKGLHLKRLLSF